MFRHHIQEHIILSLLLYELYKSDSPPLKANTSLFYLYISDRFRLGLSKTIHPVPMLVDVIMLQLGSLWYILST